MAKVAPREGRVSRNLRYPAWLPYSGVAPREGRVSRNRSGKPLLSAPICRAPRGACE